MGRLTIAALGAALACFVAEDAAPTALFARPAPPQVAQAQTDGAGYALLRLAGRTVNWTRSGSQMIPQITYAVLHESRAFASALNCNAMTPMDDALTPSGITLERFRIEAAAAAALWSDAAAIDIRETHDIDAADILIGAEKDPKGRAFTSVETSEPGGSRASRALVCFNPAVKWKTGFDGNLDVYDLRLTLAHEFGHALGLDHPGASGSLMSFRYSEANRGLTAGDRAGIVAIYGPRVTGKTTADLQRASTVR